MRVVNKYFQTMKLFIYDYINKPLDQSLSHFRDRFPSFRITSNSFFLA